MAKSKNYVYCPRCGEEMNTAAAQPHECDPRTLATLVAEEKADQETRDREKDQRPRQSWGDYRGGKRGRG